MFKFLILLLLVSGAAFGSKGGGGGLVVACYQGDDLTRVELLDIYEGRAKGIKYATLSGDWDNDVRDLALKMTKDNSHAADFIKVLTRIVSSYRSIPEDSELELTNDAFPPFLPRGCRAKQVANYYNDQLVWIDSILFNKMSYRDQLALAFHETIFYMERIYRPNTDSRYSRSVVSHLFAEKDYFDPPKSEDYEYYCAASENNFTSFLAKRIEGSESANFQISFIMLNGHYAYTKKIAELNINPSAIENEQSDVEISEPFWMSSANISSKINNGERLIVSSSSNRLYLSWQGTDPGDIIRQARIQCFKHHPYVIFFPFSFTDVQL
jgi:hypothetical protein